MILVDPHVGQVVVVDAATAEAVAAAQSATAAAGSATTAAQSATAAAGSATTAASLLAGTGYWTLRADSSTTFPARTTIPGTWVGPVIYDSTAYLNHADPPDRVAGDQHLKRTA